MKKIPFTIIIVGLIDIAFFFPIIWLIAAGAGGIIGVGIYPLSVDISFKNAPENTAYVDLLARIDTVDYVPFTAPPKRYTGYTTDENGKKQATYELLNIDENSGIARLNDDGFVSVSLHHDDAGISIRENGSIYIYTWIGTLPIPSAPNADCSFKAAYVDENGNVLGITDLAEQRYTGSSGYNISADGSGLVLGYPGRPFWVKKLAFYFLLGFEGLTLVCLAVFIVLAIVAKVTKGRELGRERSSL